MDPAETLKQREICFSALPPGQAQRAMALLAGLDGLEVTAGPDANSIRVEYHIPGYTLEGIEAALLQRGFHLDGSLLQRIRRALVHYCEQVDCDNLDAPEPCHKCREIWVRAYEHHPHGDRDETPEEWRAYR